MNPECIFCKIIAGTAPADIVYQDDQVVAFLNLHPITPVHLLICPIDHIDSVNAVEANHEPVLGHLISVARHLAAEYKVDQSGYRLVINTGPDAGQSIFHLHIHLIGGRRIPSLII